MKLNNGLFTLLVINFIKLYQRIISPLLRRWVKCRFYPSCSEYAILAIKKYGIKIGIKKTYYRLKKCRPDNLESCIDFP